MGNDQRLYNQSERVAFKYFTQRNHFLEKIKILYVMNSFIFWVAKVQILTTQYPIMNMPASNLITSRVRSVAESVKALQKSGHLPCSPKSLRRAHSMMATGAVAKITPPPINEQIYAPVAHLQQKIQQRHQGLNGKEIPNYQSHQSRQSPQSHQSC